MIGDCGGSIRVTDIDTPSTQVHHGGHRGGQRLGDMAVIHVRLVDLQLLPCKTKKRYPPTRSGYACISFQFIHGIRSAVQKQCDTNDFACTTTAIIISIIADPHPPVSLSLQPWLVSNTHDKRRSTLSTSH